MAKYIKLDQAGTDGLVEEFRKSVGNYRCSDGEFVFKKKLGEVNRKAELVFSELAWYKTIAVVYNFGKEVAWHGFAERREGDEYYISDITIYPQKVTGATVHTDDKEYATWLMGLDDEQYNTLRMQGHSHVDMSVTPSSTDWNYYKGILQSLDDKGFYIFAIFNKKQEVCPMIFDMEKNIFFDKNDIEITIEYGDLGLTEFIDGAEALVTEYKPKAAVPPVNPTKAASTFDYRSAWDDVFWDNYYSSGKGAYYDPYYADDAPGKGAEDDDPLMTDLSDIAADRLLAARNAWEKEAFES